MASSSTSLHVIDDDDEFDWEAAAQEIDVACQATAAEKPTSISNIRSNLKCNLEYPPQEMRKKGKIDVNFNSLSSTRQSTLDRFIGVSSSNSDKFMGKVEFSEPVDGNISNSNIIDDKGDGTGADFEDVEMLNGFIKIDTDAAKTWIYPVNVPRRDYQFSITRTALFSNTLVVLPTGLGKTLIAAAVMYNFFRWFPEGKIVFAAPSRPLVMQQIEACHKIVGIPQEWTIDLTGQTNPTRRADFWKNKRVFFVTPQVLEKDIQSGSCLVKHLVCLVIDEAHRAMGNYSYCVAVRELMDTPVQLRILALTATPGCKQQTIQHIIDNLQISTLEYRNETDPDVLPYVNERKIELIEVAMGVEAVEINNLLLEVVRPFVGRLCAFGVLQKRDFQTLSPCDLLNSRDKFRQEPPMGLHHTKYGEIEGYFGVLITLYHVRKLLSSHGIRPAFEMLDEKLKQGSFARLMSRNEVLLKAKLLMQQTLSHGAPSPKLAKLLEVLIDHFKVKDPQNSRVIIFSNFRGSVRDILNALTNIGEFVKATEFIGQSSGKTLKGQSQKVQQAVLQKFRTGGYNVIVATSIGEEGLDIMEVDLVVCFDANVSPLRMIQRMGRTGRKHEGRVVVLACEGSELKGYMRKQANSKAIKKHMRNGGLNSFNFHSSPRMVPHFLKPEVQFLEMSIEEFVPRGKKVKDDNPVSLPAYKTKLTVAETDLLAKYFASAGEIAWRPSLIAFPHFQAFPSRVNKVVHSSRTGMLIDMMQYLQGLTFSEDNKILLAEDEDISDPCPRAEAVQPYCEIKEGSERSSDTEEKLKTEELEIDRELQKIDKDMRIEDFHKQKACLHTFLFVSEFVSVDDNGNVLVLSLPQLAVESNSKHMDGSSMASVCHLMPESEDHEENTVQAKDNPSSHLPEVQILVDSRLCNTDMQNGKLLSGAEEIFYTPVSDKMPKEMDLYGEDPNIVHDRKLMPLADEPSKDFEDSVLSPRLNNLIKSGIVPESPVNDSGTWNGDRGGDFTGPAFVSSPNLQSEVFINSSKQDGKALQDDSLKKMEVPCSSDNEMQTPELQWKNNAPKTCTSPIPVAEEMQTPFARLSEASTSKDWLLDSGVKPETVHQQCKFRRLRKHGDFNRKIPPEPKEQAEPSRKHRTSRRTDYHTATKLFKGEEKRAKDVTIYIEEEAEVSSEAMASNDEEDDQDNSSYEDSFIDDDANPTSAGTQAGPSKTDMMAIYRRSLLSQSPFQGLPNFATNFSPDSVFQSSRINESGSSSGMKHDPTPQTGLESTARNSQLACLEIPSEMADSKLESRKRKLSFYQAQSVPTVNLDKEFSLISEAPGKNSAMQIQAEKAEENRDIFEDDQFYEGIDLDAVEEEAAKLLRYKTDCSTQQTANVSEPIQHNLGVLGSPSFDLRF
ncbi:uncharacterized protein LOC105175667 [Sesamum indicum]|uniref:Uncharacterized protein LOC105175667 n=1 Tax=Sesamum indicum TaxID=4182 RepID=A0A6I9UPH0_SESIN|nr:uncharacterized protein LOC105175667 [Sesamum indicum]